MAPFPNQVMMSTAASKTVSTANPKGPVAQPAPAATVKITDDRSTTESTATSPPSFGRDSAFGVRPKGKKGDWAKATAHAMLQGKLLMHEWHPCQD